MTSARFTPALNCRPGDIARIIHRGHNLDRLVMVREFSNGSPDFHVDSFLAGL